MADKLERVDLVLPDKLKGLFGSYYPPPEPVPHLLTRNLKKFTLLIEYMLL